MLSKNAPAPKVGDEVCGDRGTFYRIVELTYWGDQLKGTCADIRGAVLVDSLGGCYPIPGEIFRTAYSRVNESPNEDAKNMPRKLIITAKGRNASMDVCVVDRLIFCDMPRVDIAGGRVVRRFDDGVVPITHRHQLAKDTEFVRSSREWSYCGPCAVSAGVAKWEA